MVSIGERLGDQHALALAFLADAYTGVRTRPGKGLEHARAVAGVLVDYGYDERLLLVALLHDVVEDTAREVGDVRAAFGEEVAAMVGALSEDPAITAYGPRKRALREQIATAGSPVVDVALADKIAILRHARATATKVPKRKIAHYRATLSLATASGQAPRLRAELEALLTAHP